MPLRTLRKNHNAGAIERLVKQGGLYAGASAGAIIAGRSIHSCEIKGWDDPGVGEGWDLGATSRGLDSFNLLVGGASVFPHFSPGWAQPIAAAAAEFPEGLLILGQTQHYTQDPARGGRLCGEEECIDASSSAWCGRRVQTLAVCEAFGSPPLLESEE